MNTTKKALLCTAVILTACFLGISLFPKDNSGADQGLLRIGAGDDISGYLISFGIDNKNTIIPYLCNISFLIRNKMNIANVRI